MATPIPSNTCSFSLREVTAATGGTLTRQIETDVTGVTTDSRAIGAGTLFVALRGSRFNGHDYLPAAAAHGAAAAIVERGQSHVSLPCIEVDDTLRALGALARHHLERIRARTGLRVIAVGGANGKTSTKELSAALATALFGPTLKTAGNLNNLIGVPMTIFTLAENYRAAVIECGTNQRGEVAQLTGILRPDVALVLNVDIEHSEGLGTIDEIADEEASLFDCAAAAVACFEETKVTARIPAGLRTITFGRSESADVRFDRTVTATPERSAIELHLAPAMVDAGVEPRLRVRLNLLGPAAASNAAAAMAAVGAAIARPLSRAELERMVSALEAVPPVPGRLNARIIGAIVVIDDTYNANPRSVRVALETASEIAHARKSRLIIALGDMLELGAVSGQMHREAIRDVAAASPAEFIAVGPLVGAAWRAEAGHSSISSVHSFANSLDAAQQITEIVRPGDVLLVKGSRGIAMERLIAALES
ncbi:MAG: UDP-N-acetylmuramoyl-tripeptide--D-alanyl-D-alanine ligase [Candidatus Binataceae bacterium]|nr:UDP-N-acetylmuramoyl-tripeptide--D-alanyl-D-alanine ligase [Candidatus Binataceae bacterium]